MFEPAIPEPPKPTPFSPLITSSLLLSRMMLYITEFGVFIKCRLNCVYIFRVYVFCHVEVASGFVTLHKQGCRTLVRIPAEQIFSFLHQLQIVPGTHSSFYSTCTGLISQSRAMELTIHLHLMSTFRISGAIPPLSIYPFIVRTKNLLFTPTKFAFRNIISLNYLKISILLCKPHNITIDQCEV